MNLAKIDKAKVKYVSGELLEFESDLLKFMAKHFDRNPVNVLIPIGADDWENFSKLFVGNLNVLAFYNKKIIGCSTGTFLPYGKLLEVWQKNLTTNLIVSQNF